MHYNNNFSHILMPDLLVKNPSPSEQPSTHFPVKDKTKNAERWKNVNRNMIFHFSMELTLSAVLSLCAQFMHSLFHNRNSIEIIFSPPMCFTFGYVSMD